MTLHRVNPEREPSIMSNKFPAPALGALLMFAAIAPEPALAQRPAATRHTYAYGHRHWHGAYGYLYQPQIHDFNGGLSAGAEASSTYPRPERRLARPFQTDPDPRIRIEMQRDDFDRRLGGS
jgi:hypothetical protein